MSRHAPERERSYRAGDNRPPLRFTTAHGRGAEPPPNSDRLVESTRSGLRVVKNVHRASPPPESTSVKQDLPVSARLETGTRSAVSLSTQDSPRHVSPHLELGSQQKRRHDEPQFSPRSDGDHTVKRIRLESSPPDHNNRADYHRWPPAVHAGPDQPTSASRDMMRHHYDGGRERRESQGSSQGLRYYGDNDTRRSPGSYLVKRSRSPNARGRSPNRTPAERDAPVRDRGMYRDRSPAPDRYRPASGGQPNSHDRGGDGRGAHWYPPTPHASAQSQPPRYDANRHEYYGRLHDRHDNRALAEQRDMATRFQRPADREHFLSRDDRRGDARHDARPSGQSRPHYSDLSGVQNSAPNDGRSQADRSRHYDRGRTSTSDGSSQSRNERHDKSDRTASRSHVTATVSITPETDAGRGKEAPLERNPPSEAFIPPVTVAEGPAAFVDVSRATVGDTDKGTIRESPKDGSPSRSTSFSVEENSAVRDNEALSRGAAEAAEPANVLFELFAGKPPISKGAIHLALDTVHGMSQSYLPAHLARLLRGIASSASRPSRTIEFNQYGPASSLTEVRVAQDLRPIATPAQIDVYCTAPGWAKDAFTGGFAPPLR